MCKFFSNLSVFNSGNVSLPMVIHMSNNLKHFGVDCWRNSSRRFLAFDRSLLDISTPLSKCWTEHLPSSSSPSRNAKKTPKRHA